MFPKIARPAVLLLICVLLMAAGSARQPTASDVVFRDNFEYAVERSDSAAAQLFIKQGWSHVKTHQNASGAKGYLYTTEKIPGYSGPLPGGGARVLAMEAKPQTLGAQTDFYLGLGNGSSPAFDNYIPGDVWIQFWLYPLQQPGQASTYGTREKFLYVCKTDYPCHTHLWMIMSGSATYNSGNMFPLGHPSQGQFLWTLRKADGVSDINNSRGDPDARGNIGSPNPSEWMRPNRWTLVKMHFKTTSTTGNSWEVWLRPLGGKWVKVSEWIGGKTAGFTWNIPESSVGGHRVLRMPTTMDFDKTMFLDDFVIARTESALPTY